MKKRLVLILLMCIGFNALAQKTINNYEYVIIPLEYDFLDGKNKYRLNTLTRYLFKQEGFIVLFDEEQFPANLKKDRCIALKANVKEVKGGFLATKLQIFLEDCFGEEVFSSEIGTSRKKDFKEAYSEALRRAFESIEQLDYKYEPISIREEVKANKDQNEAVEIKEVQAEEAVTDTSKVEASVEKVEDVKKVEKLELVEESANKVTLYAQEKAYGYQLVDSEPKVVMHLLSTSAKNVFLVKDKNAIVYKEDGVWYQSENDGKLKEPKILNIKF